MKRRGTLVAGLTAIALVTSVTFVSTTTSAAGGPAPAAESSDADTRAVGLTAAEGTAVATGVKITVADDPGEHLYLIRFADPAVPEFAKASDRVWADASIDGRKLDAESAPVRAYVSDLEEAHADFLDTAAATLGRRPVVKFEYTYAINGMAVVLTAAEVRALAKTPGIVSIAPDQQRELHTDSGPTWINADAAWNAVADLGLPADYQGEGMVIGVIDTGISPANPSFADIGADGYDHTNPLGSGNYLGECATTPGICNDKLIGVWDFLGEGDDGIDYDGHGSHTASTSGGNVVEDVEISDGVLLDISGVAPHANIVSYLGCCSTAGLTGSIDQAIEDGVDVINYSIGSSSPSAAWDDFDSVGYLNAREAGIFVATSAGNDGSGANTVGSPADAPWITSVGATTHNRWNGNTVSGLTSSEGTLPDILGKGVTEALAVPTAIIDAASVGDPLCLANTGHAVEFTGKIVICTRGTNGRVEKSENVAAQGAVGFILIQNEANAGLGGLGGDVFAVPGVSITYEDGIELRAWLADGTGHVATISGVDYITGVAGEAYADILASFSSRGANRAVDTLVPSLTAPGVDILAALTDTGAPNGGAVFGVISGTSMASPHVAGAGALVMQARPDWSPAEVQSALMTTAAPVVVNNTGEPATPYQQGSGRIDVGAALMAGLLFDESIADYEAANPDEGGDPKSLNIPSFANSQCLVECTWTRTAVVPASAPAGVTWTAGVVADTDLSVDVDLSPVGPVDPGDTITITVTADVSAGTPDDTYFARITLTPDNADVPAATLPLAAVATSAILPDRVDFDTRRNAGSDIVADVMSGPVADVSGTVAWTLPTVVEGAVEEDTTVDPFPDGAYNLDGGVAIYTVDVPAGTGLLHAALSDAAAPDLDLFVGTGTTPSFATEVCFSASGGSNEECQVTDPAPGTYWIMVHNFEGTAPGVEDPFTLTYAAVPTADNGTGTVSGPVGPIVSGEPYDVTVTWDLPGAEEGDVYFGVVTIDDVGSIPATLTRHADDVTKEASVTDAAPGDPIDYTITVEPNVTPADLEYTIVDTVPDGLTIDPASVSDGGVVAGQTITWTLPMPSPYLADFSFVASTPDDNPDCAAWGGFLDLGPLGIGLNPNLTGDTVAINAFSAIGPWSYFGESFPGLVVAEDGFVTVTGGYGGAPWAPQELPDAAAPNGVIAPLWSDLEASVADGRGVRIAQNSGLGAAIVQWDELFEYTSNSAIGPSVGNFQLWMYNTVADDRPEMTFEYGEVGALPSFATIGVENFAGDAGTAIVNADDPAGTAVAGETVCLDYVGPTFDPATLTYSVEVDALDPGTLDFEAVNTVTSITDNPGDALAETSATVNIDGNATELAILTVNDFHGRIDGTLAGTPPCPTELSASPALQFAGTVEQRRAAHGEENTLFVGAGDLIGASLFPSATLGDQPTIDLMNALDLDASAVGNHEFDQGFADLTDRVIDEGNNAAWDYLGSNVRYASDGSAALTEYGIYERAGLTVAVIGAVTEDTPLLVSPAGVADLEFINMVEAVNDTVDFLTGPDSPAVPDVIVATFHDGSGLASPATLEQAIAESPKFAALVNDLSPDIDAIVNGHTHREYAWSAPIPGGGGATRPIIQTGEYGARVGEIVLTVSDDGEVLAHTQQNVVATTTPLATLVSTYPRVAEAREIVCDAMVNARVVGDEVIGEVTADITTAFLPGSYTGPGNTFTGTTRDDRWADSTLGRLVGNALRDSFQDDNVATVAEYGPVDIGLINSGGGLRNELRYAASGPESEPGQIRFAEANAVLPFVNNIWTVTLTGAEFKQVLEQQWKVPAISGRSFLSLGLSDNVTYTYDNQLPLGSRVTSITINGVPYDPAGEYRVATISFLTAGGDAFTAFLDGEDDVDTGLVDRDVWIQYIKDNTPLSPDFARQSAQVTGLPTTAEEGSDLVFTVGKPDAINTAPGPSNTTLDMRSIGSPQNTSIEVFLDGESIGTAPVASGIAAVDVTVPACTSAGIHDLTLVATPSGTTISTTLDVTAASATCPAAPTGVTATSHEDSQSTVSWTTADDGGSPITEYTVTADPGGETCTTAGATTCVVENLTNGTEYTFTVIATNALGDSPSSDPSDPAIPGAVPDAPTGAVGVAGIAAVTVSWTAPADDGGLPITGYTVTAAPGGATCTTSGATTCIVSGLDSTVEYTFTVVATNAVGDSPASAPSAGVTPLPTPGGTEAPLVAAIDPLRLFDTRPTEPQGDITVAQHTYGGDDVLMINVYDVIGMPTEGIGAVALNVTAVDPAAPGYVTVYPCGDRPLVSNINYMGPGVYPNAVIVPVSDDGDLCFYSKEQTHLIADMAGWFPSEGGIGTLTPTRLFDTRTTEPDGAIPVVKQQYGGDANILTINVSDVAGIPADGVGAVVLNVTAVNPVGPGYVTVYPCGTRPLASSVNYSGPGVYPNAVITPVSEDGDICFYSKENTDLIADVSAWLPEGDDFGALTPTRLFDTRPTEPVGAIDVAKVKVGGDANILTINVLDVAGIPADGVGLVSLNVTAVDPEGPGYVTVYPCGDRPLVSNVNYSGPGVYPNAVLVPVSDDGEICFFSKENTHLIADVNGWFAAP